MFWKYSFSQFTRSYSDKEISLINVGYADLAKPEGLFVQKKQNPFDKYRLQLYHYCVIHNGKLNDMNNKTLLETGCGRGGGFNYIVQ